MEKPHSGTILIIVPLGGVREVEYLNVVIREKQDKHNNICNNDECFGFFLQAGYKVGNVIRRTRLVSF